MKKVRRVSLKPKFSAFLKTIGIIACLCLGIFLFYNKQIHDLEKLGYSKEASQKILFSFKKDYVMSVGESKTLNRVFEDELFREEYADTYRKIDYVEQEHFVEHVHQLLDKKYTVSDINLIFKHGNDQDIEEFAKRDRVRYLEEFFSTDYAKLRYYDRYVAYSDETGEDGETTVLLVNLDMDKEAYVDPTLVSQFSYDMLVNQHRSLSEDFVPEDLVTVPSEYASGDDFQCNMVALEAFKMMSKAAESQGYGILINSAYRSYQDQLDIIDYYLRAYGQNYVDKYVAKAGYSEHQTGLALDIKSKTVGTFANSKEYQWMLENAHQYGFIYRFSKRGEFFTGFREEAWHYRYVGKEIATYIHDHNMTLEEYWAKNLDK